MTASSRAGCRLLSSRIRIRWNLKLRRSIVDPPQSLGVPDILWRLGDPHLENEIWTWLTLFFLPVLPCQFAHSRSNRTRVIMEICRKISITHIPPSRSLKVIGTGTDRSATYDFLIVIHGTYSRISYRFRDNWQYLQKFVHPFYLPSPLRGSLGIL